MGPFQANGSQLVALGHDEKRSRPPDFQPNQWSSHLRKDVLFKWIFLEFCLGSEKGPPTDTDSPLCCSHASEKVAAPFPKLTSLPATWSFLSSESPVGCVRASAQPERGAQGLGGHESACCEPQYRGDALLCSGHLHPGLIEVR